MRSLFENPAVLPLLLTAIMLSIVAMILTKKGKSWILGAISLMALLVMGKVIYNVSDDSQTQPKLTEDQRTVTREESDAFKEKVITSKVFMINHEGVDVPWKMRDGNKVLRPVRIEFAAKEYQMTGYHLNRNAVRSLAWDTTVTNPDLSSVRANMPTCDVVKFRLTDKTTAKELALKATIDLEWSLDRKLPKMSEKQRILQQLQDPNYGQPEEVAETNTEPTKDEDVPQKADKPSNVW